jgi:hypothetical protein
MIKTTMRAFSNSTARILMHLAGLSINRGYAEEFDSG